jgi:hypothetical protein
MGCWIDMFLSCVGRKVTPGRADARRGDLRETADGERGAVRGGDPTRGKEDNQAVSESSLVNLSNSSTYFSLTRCVELEQYRDAPTRLPDPVSRLPLFLKGRVRRLAMQVGLSTVGLRMGQ